MELHEQTTSALHAPASSFCHLCRATSFIMGRCCVADECRISRNLPNPISTLKTKHKTDFLRWGDWGPSRSGAACGREIWSEEAGPCWSSSAMAWKFSHSVKLGLGCGFPGPPFDPPGPFSVTHSNYTSSCNKVSQKQNRIWASCDFTQVVPKNGSNTPQNTHLLFSPTPSHGTEVSLCRQTAERDCVW